MPHSSPADPSPSPSSDSKSLTPQRKHRKMLKDGTSEVWPESVEKIFVQGLRQYWDSPWATYSRGRSRWRNQFLVDFLASNGIQRTKKQVASHIQVLRNMWKGEPEYQLVAGGEELFQENGLLAPANLKERSPDSVASEISVKEEQRDAFSPLTPATPNSASDYSFDDMRGSHLPSPGALAFSPHPRSSQLYLTPLSPFSSPSRVAEQRPAKDESLALSSPFIFHETSRTPFPTFPLPLSHLPLNSLSSLSLWADGMQPLSVDVDRLVDASRSPVHPSAAVRVCINIKLSLAPLDTPGAPMLYGFQAALTFAAPWASAAQCITRVHGADGSQQEEVGAFEALAPGGTAATAASSGASPAGGGNASQPVTALFPDSCLARCRWLPAGVETRITQHVIVDNEELAYIVYELHRPFDAVPAAEFVGFNMESRTRTPLPLSHRPQPSSSSSVDLLSPASSLYPVNWSSPSTSFTPRMDDAPFFSCPPSNNGAPLPHLSPSDMAHTHTPHYSYPSSALFS